MYYQNIVEHCLMHLANPAVLRPTYTVIVVMPNVSETLYGFIIHRSIHITRIRNILT